MEDESHVIVEITTHLSMIIMPQLVQVVVTIEKPLIAKLLNATSSQEVPEVKDRFSKGKEVVSARPKRRRERTKSKKPSYREDNASEDADSQGKGAEDSHALG